MPLPLIKFELLQVGRLEVGNYFTIFFYKREIRSDTVSGFCSFPETLGHIFPDKAQMCRGMQNTFEL